MRTRNERAPYSRYQTQHSCYLGPSEGDDHGAAREGDHYGHLLSFDGAKPTTQSLSPPNVNCSKGAAQ